MHDFRTCFWMRWFSVHGIGHNGFQSMVLDASACINMYYNIERKLMKNQAGSLGFGIQGKSLCICVLYVMLSHYLLSVFENSYAGNFCTGLKPTFGIRAVLDSRGHLCC